MKILMLLLVGTLMISCGEDKKKKSQVSTKLRSTGVSSLGLTAKNSSQTSMSLLSLPQGNTVQLDYYKVPIRRINLVTGGKTGGGYTGTSPNFYTCEETKTDAECMVDLSSAITVDNLLTGSSSTEFALDSAVTYDGATVEFCKDGSQGSTYKILVKGKVTIGSTVYYTSKTKGLSSSLTAAEEAEISVACSGMTTYFAESYTVAPESSTSLVIYADPSGNVFGVSGINAKSLANTNCLGEETLALCAGNPSIFVTVDTATPTVERYLLDVSTTSNGAPYRDLLVKMLFNSANKPIGATVQEFYRNDQASKSLMTAFMQMGTVTEKTATTFDIGYSSDVVISNFVRGSSSSNTISKVASETLTFSQSKIQ